MITEEAKMLDKVSQQFLESIETAYYDPYRDQIYQVTEGPYIYFLNFEGIPILIWKERFKELFASWTRLGEI